MSVDIDKQKIINDCFGFQVGDLVIRHVASCLLYKVSWKPHPVFRIGGDEFFVFLRGVDAKRAQVWAQAITENLKCFHLKSTALYKEITLTIGIADSYNGKTWDRVVFAADNAVHRSKHEGRDRIAISEDTDYLFPLEK